MVPGIGSKPYPKSIPNRPKAGINIRTPKPAERFNSKGLKSLNPSYDAPPSAKVKAKIDADGFKVIGYLNSKLYLL